MSNSTSNEHDSSHKGESQARPQFDWSKLRKAIESFEKERLCYLPAGWGQKEPSVKWKPFQIRAPTMGEKASWFHEGKLINVGVLCGGISGGRKLQQGRLD